MKILFFVLVTSLFPLLTFAQPQKFDEFSKRFVSGYQSLHIPDLDLSYVSGLQHIRSADSIQKQLDFFRSVQKELPSYITEALNFSQKADYDLITYETNLN